MNNSSQFMMEMANLMTRINLFSRNLLIILFIFSGMFEPVFGQSFQYLYKTPEDENVNDIIEDSSGNFFLICQIGNFNAAANNASYDALIIKLNSTSDTVATKRLFSFSNYFVLTQGFRISDSLFYAIGTLRTPGNDYQVVYVQFDNNLNVQIIKVMGDTAISEFVDISKQTFNNEILITGIAKINQFESRAFLYRLNENGDSLSAISLGVPNWLIYGMDVLELQDTTGYLMFTLFWPSPNSSPHNEIIKIDYSGTIDTIVEFSNILNVNASWISSDKFVVSGIADSISHREGNVRFYKNDLTTLDSVGIGKQDTSENIGINPIAIKDSNTFYTGYTSNWQSTGLFFANVKSYFMLSKLNAFGNSVNVQWTNYYEYNDQFLFCQKVLAASDGGVVLAGSAHDYFNTSVQERDIYVIKVDSMGNLVSIPDGISKSDFVVYPNPVVDKLNIEIPPVIAEYSFELFNSTGQRIRYCQLKESTELNLSDLMDGIYFYRFLSGRTSHTGKLIKNSSE